MPLFKSIKLNLRAYFPNITSEYGEDFITQLDYSTRLLEKIKELEQMAQRVKAAKLLKEGKTYNQVMSECEISSATLSRVSRCVQYGQGYKKFVK